MLGIFLSICVEPLATNCSNFTQQNIHRFYVAFFLEGKCRRKRPKHFHIPFFPLNLEKEQSTSDYPIITVHRKKSGPLFTVFA